MSLARAAYCSSTSLERAAKVVSRSLALRSHWPAASSVASAAAAPAAAPRSRSSALASFAASPEIRRSASSPAAVARAVAPLALL